MRFLLRSIFPPLAVFVLVTVALQTMTTLRHMPPYLLPAPTRVLSALLQRRGELAAATLVTTEAALIGFVGSMLLGVLIGVGLASSDLVRRALYPYAVFFQTVPLVALAPLLVIWFDAGLTSVALSSFIASVFPVIANTLTGLRSTDPALLDLFTLYRSGAIARLLKLRLPAATPSIVAGLRVAAGLAVIGAVVGEFLVGNLGDNEGLGVKIVGAMRTGHTDFVFAAVLLASLLGLFLFGAVNLLGYVLLRRWHASEQRRG